MRKKEELPYAIDVLFTGLIREYETFKRSLDTLSDLRKMGFVNKIILATRIGETEKHPEMHASFKQANVKIVEAEDPEINENSPYYGGRDFIWRQMRSFEVGLKSVENGRFVLKTRSDVYVNPKFIEKLAREKESLLKIKKNLPMGNIFKFKVWVPWFELTKPFFMADECFFGLKEDLEKLYNYDKDYFEKYDLGTDVHHVMRYIHPFLDKYNIFYKALNKYNKDRSFKNFVKRNSGKWYEYLKKFNSLKIMSERSRFNVLNKRLEDNQYIDLLSAYYFVLYSHFYIDLVSFSDQIEFRDFYKGKLPKSDNKTAENNFSPNMVRFPGSGMIYFYEMNFINAIFEHKLQNSPLKNRFNQGIKNFESS